MSKLSLVDTGFLMTESPNSPKHVGCLQVWRLPKGKGSAWLRRMLADLKQEEAGFPFDQKLDEKIPLQPELAADEKIDMDYPVHRYFLWARQISMTLGSATRHLTRIGHTLAS